MYLRTMTSLVCEDKETIIHKEEYIKVYLDNGEILMGTYQYSDCDSLIIDRLDTEIEIMFEDIKDIEHMNIVIEIRRWDYEKE